MYEQVQGEGNKTLTNLNNPSVFKYYESFCLVFFYFHSFFFQLLYDFLIFVNIYPCRGEITEEHERDAVEEKHKQFYVVILSDSTVNIALNINSYK